MFINMYHSYLVKMIPEMLVRKLLRTYQEKNIEKVRLAFLLEAMVLL